MSWTKLRLGDIITLQRGHDLPHSDRVEGDVPVVSSSGVTGWHNQAKAKAPGVVTGRYGTLGQVYFINQDYWPLNTSLYVVDFKWNSPQFVAYLLENTLRKIQSDKAAVPGFNRNVLHDLNVLAPDRTQQDRIVLTLSAYDDLIENNRRRMELLEASARHLYEEWFVRLRFPGHEHTRMVGGLPEGWKTVKIDELVTIKHGCAFKGEFFSDNVTSRILVTPGNFDIGGGFKLQKCKYYSEDGPLDSHYVLSPLDLVLTMTDLSKESDTLGYPALIPNLDDIVFLHNQRIGRIVPKIAGLPKYFLYFRFCSPSYRQHIVGAATGTSVKHTSPGRIASYSISLPCFEGCLNEFEQYGELVFRQINCLIQHSAKLQSARDILLPRLMSGEVTV